MEDTTIKDNCIVLTVRLYCHRGPDWINPITIRREEEEAAATQKGENKFSFFLFSNKCGFFVRLGSSYCWPVNRNSLDIQSRQGACFAFPVQPGSMTDLSNSRLVRKMQVVDAAYVCLVVRLTMSGCVCWVKMRSNHPNLSWPQHSIFGLFKNWYNCNALPVLITEWVSL